MKKTRTQAAIAPVARVLPLLGIAHLDRHFDYLVDSDQDTQAQPGVRVRIRFGGRKVDAIILERRAHSGHSGQLRWLERIISPEIVYPEQTRQLVEALAQRYAGTTSDLIRAAIPPRHAQAEQADTTTAWDELGSTEQPDLSLWSGYQYGESFVDAVLGGQVARAAWQVSPGDSWAEGVASLGTQVALEGRSVLVIVPDQRDVDYCAAAFGRYLSAKQITTYTAALGPQARYRRFLSILHGQARVVIGTRSAAFAPLHNLGLAVIKDDGDENLSDPRAPYAHAREIITTKVAQVKSSLLMVGTTRTAETQLLVERGWLHDLVASRGALRVRTPLIRAVGDSDFELERDPRARSARLPSLAYQALQAGLERGQPVLMQVPRKGYVPVLACGACRTTARCRHCNGPLQLSGGGSQQLASCRWCGRVETRFRCMECGSHRLRAIVLGTDRTAEELGRAFPNTRVITSGGNHIVETVSHSPAIVVATPGAEPRVEDGAYGAVILVDTWAVLGRDDLRASEQALATWAHAASLAHPRTRDGEVIIVADPAHPVVQHLIRWDMVGAARRELEQRRDVHLPPVAAMAAIDGPQAALEAFLGQLELPEHAEILGPVDLPPGVKLPGEYDTASFGVPQRLLIRMPRGQRSQLGELLRAGLVARGAKKETLPLRVQVDPVRIG